MIHDNKGPTAIRYFNPVIHADYADPDVSTRDASGCLFHQLPGTATLSYSLAKFNHMLNAIRLNTTGVSAGKGDLGALHSFRWRPVLGFVLPDEGFLFDARDPREVERTLLPESVLGPFRD
jgi:hypothetical protein